MSSSYAELVRSASSRQKIGRAAVVVLAFAALAATIACSSDNNASADASNPSANPEAGSTTSSSSSSSGGSPDATSGDASDGAAAAALASADHAAADAAFEALLLSFWDGNYLKNDRVATAHTGYWIFAQAFDDVIDAVDRTGGRYAGLIETFYDAQNVIGWSRDFFDDENWMALALIRAFDLTGKANYLTQAQSLFNDIKNSAQDSTCCLTPNGGLWWDRPHTQKATAANAGAVITATRLSQRTNDASLLDFAKTVFAYWDAHMVDPATHAVFDHVVPGGQIVKYKFTYNEGLMIGACLALFDATKDPKYLTEANAIAGYMIKEETELTTLGPVLFDGTNANCTGDCAQFKGIGYRYLAALQVVSPNPQYAAVLDASVKSISSVARDTASGLFGVDWTKPAGNLVVQGQNSATAALSLYASAKGPYATSLSTTTFEAEEGVLHGVGLEARYAGFQGFGYVAGWQGDGQYVDFHFKTTPGKYKLTFRYAAGAGDASRLLHVNGADVVDDLAFPSTGTNAWDKYTTVDSIQQLTADNVVSLVYNSGKGSKSFVNLDQLTIAPSP